MNRVSFGQTFAAKTSIDRPRSISIIPRAFFHMCFCTKSLPDYVRDRPSNGEVAVSNYCVYCCTGFEAAKRLRNTFIFPDTLPLLWTQSSPLKSDLTCSKGRSIVTGWVYRYSFLSDKENSADEHVDKWHPEYKVHRKVPHHTRPCACMEVSHTDL